MATAKYRALDAAVTGLPWTTGTVHTAKCSKGFEVNKDMFRRCKACSYLLCSKCYNRDGFGHQCIDGGQTAQGPFPTQTQEAEVMRVFNATIPPRDANKPKQKFHSTAWQWTPPPEILKSYPQIRLEGQTLLAGPSPVAGASGASSLSTPKMRAKSSTPRPHSTNRAASSSKTTASVTETGTKLHEETKSVRVKESSPPQPQPTPSLPSLAVAISETHAESAPVIDRDVPNLVQKAGQNVPSMAPNTSVADSMESGSSASDDVSALGRGLDAADAELSQVTGSSPEATFTGSRSRGELKRKAIELEDDEDHEVDDTDEPTVSRSPTGRGGKRGRGGRGRGGGSRAGGPSRSSRAQTVAAQRSAARKAKSIMKNNLAQGFESDENIDQAFENGLQDKRTIQIDVRGIDTFNLTLLPGHRLGGPTTNSAALDSAQQNGPIQLPVQLFYQWQNSTLNYQLERNVIAMIDAPGLEINVPASSTVGPNWRYDGTGKSMSRDIHNVFLRAITGNETAGDVDSFSKPLGEEKNVPCPADAVHGEFNSSEEAIEEAGSLEEDLVEELGIEDDEMMEDEEMKDADEYENDQEDEEGVPKADDEYEETEDDDLYTDD